MSRSQRAWTGVLAGSLVVGCLFAPGLATGVERAKASQTAAVSASPSTGTSPGASPRKVSPYAKANRMGAPRSDKDNRPRSLTPTRPGQQSGRWRPPQTR